MSSDPWPPLSLDAWRPTYRSLHMCTQIVGKVRMALAPPVNHWWHVALHVSPRGLTTGPVPHQLGLLEIEFDFHRGELRIDCSDRPSRTLPLPPKSIAAFYEELISALGELGISCSIWSKPQEVPEPVLFEHDVASCEYDPDAVLRFWRILVSSRNVLERFRSHWIGKVSPVHFFWGSFDLACTRFSGRAAPPRKGAISGPAYSHEVSSVGFWPGGNGVEAAFYSYFVPAPAGIENSAIRPAAAKWDRNLSEFLLMYDDVRSAPSPEEALYDFAQSTYEAGATLGKWDRAALEI